MSTLAVARHTHINTSDSESQARLRVSLPRVVKSEWIKFWSLRSSWITLAAALYGTGSASLADPGVLRAVIGTGVYLTGAGILGLALGALLRSTAAAISTLFGVMFLLPSISMFLLPDSWNENIAPYLPSEAGGAFTAVSQTATQLSPWTGLAVFAGYLIVLITAAAWRLQTQDA